MHSIATIVILTIAACAAPALASPQVPFGGAPAAGQQSPAGGQANAGGGNLSFPQQSPTPIYGAQGAKGSTASEIRIKNGNETIELTVGVGDSVVLNIDGDPEFGKRVRYKDECIELLSHDGSVLLEIRSLVNDGTGKLVYSPRKVRAYLGASVAFADETLATQLGLDPNDIGVVTSVTEGSPAATAGLQVHDVITRIGGEAAGRGDRMRAVLATKKPGDELRLAILRKGKAQELVVRLTALDEGAVVARKDVPFLGNIPILGFSFRPGKNAGGAPVVTFENPNNKNSDDRAAGIWRALGPDGTLRFSGRVTDSKGDPVPNANIIGGGAEPRGADAIESLLRKLEARLTQIESKLEALQRK